MSADVIPAGIESWRKCPDSGCRVMVWGSLARPNYCTLHGGTPHFQRQEDPFGNPVEQTQAGTLHRPAPAQ